jgi:hypothetical protein
MIPATATRENCKVERAKTAEGTRWMPISVCVPHGRNQYHEFEKNARAF